MNRPINADSFWTYENGVLKNKQNIKNQKELDELEEKIIKNKLKNIPNIKFTKENFLNLHKYLYQELYDFAGILRNENVVYNGLMACQYEVIDLCLTDLFSKTYKEDLSTTIAYLYSELMIILPFRDGNETVIELFLENYTKNKKYSLNFKTINKEKLTEALTYAFYKDTSKLINIFKNNIKTLNQ